MLLIGNAWRLRDILAGNLNPSSAFRQWVMKKFELMGLQTVEWIGDGLPDIDSTKHYVSLGALQEAKRAGTEQNPAAQGGTKLPAGRRLEFPDDQIRFEWHDLVGDGVENSILPDGAAGKRIDFDLKDLPPCEGKWADTLKNVFSDLPSDDQFRQEVITAIESNRLLKGPLQLLIEKHWKRRILR